MVVARKTPVAPAPPASRSNSSQPLQRPLKPKVSPPAANNKTSTTPPPATSKPSPVKKKPNRTSSWFRQRLFLLLLSAFSVYAALVCRTDFPRTSPVCRSLDAYRTHILEPYVVPPLQSLVHHTEPHLAPLKPYVAPLKPYATSAIDFTNTHVIPRATTAAAFVARQYRTHVAPRLYWFFITQYWNGIIKPIYFKGIHPFLEPQTRPYRVYYRRFIVPLARRTAAYAHAWYLHLRPHVVHYLKQARRHMCTVYKAVKPHMIKVYLQVRPHVVMLLEQAKEQALMVARKAGDARREYVDPHVRRIWEKVGEAEVVSSFKSSSPTPTTTASSNPTATQVVAEEPTAAEPTSAVASASSIISAEATQAVQPTPVVIAEVEVEASIPAPETSSEEAAIPPPSAPAPFSESPIPTTEPAATVAASVVAASLHATELKDGDPVDEFLKAIGLDDDQEQGPHTPVSSSPAASDALATGDPDTYGDTVPSQEERARITAEKRENITGRHKQWQADLDALVKEVTKNVHATLGESRAKAVEELEKWGKEGKGVVSEVEAEADRLMMGLEAYLKGVGAKGAKATEGEKEKWKKVLGKVEERFKEKVHGVQRDVHTWFMGLRDKEVAEVDAAAATVKGFAERAQADLGLDYAWLDDVTYYDWQKYHDLMRTSENFTAAAQAIQAAVDPKGTNLLVDTLNELEEAVSDVIDGFAFVIKGIKLRSEAPGGAFYEEPEPEAESNETSDEAKKGKDTEEEPQVSILPIESPELPSTTPPKNPPGAPVAPATPLIDVVIGRSKEEVEAKLAGVPVETTRASREEL